MMNVNLAIYLRGACCLLAFVFSVNSFANYTVASANSTPDKPDWSIVRSTQLEACRAYVQKYEPREFAENPERIYVKSPNGCYGGYDWQRFFGNIQPVTAPTPTPLPTPVPTPAPKDCSPQKGRLVNAAANDEGQICVEQCRANPVKIVQQCAGTTGLCLGSWGGQYRYDGVRCNGSEISVPPHDATDNPELMNEGLKKKLTPYDCAAKGKIAGEVNGQTVCVNNDGTSNLKTTEYSTEKTQNPDGTTTEISTKETTQDDGVTVMKQSEQNSTIRNPDGTLKASGVQASATEMSKEKYCKANPNEENCRGNTVNGDCQKPFVCKGDVVACESAKVGWLSYCAGEKRAEQEALDIQKLKDSDDYKLGIESMKGMTADQKEKLGLNADSIDISKQLDQKSWLSGSSNLSDVQITVMGDQITLPLSKANEPLEWMGAIAVAFSLLAAWRIIIGAK